jgi:hypothetical protein
LVDSKEPRKDEDSIDSDEREERQAESQKAERIFSSIAGIGSDHIRKQDFGKLIEALGTTYCEEEHRRTIKTLSQSDGTISKSSFVRWYVDWLFDGDNESIDDTPPSEDGDDGVSDHDASESHVKSAMGANVGWGDAFTTVGSKWKCDVCMVNNEVSLQKCASCEADRPGSVKEDLQSAHKPPKGVLDQTGMFGSVKSIGIGAKSSFIFSAVNAPSMPTTSDDSKDDNRGILDPPGMQTSFPPFQPALAPVSGGFVFNATSQIPDTNASVKAIGPLGVPTNTSSSGDSDTPSDRHGQKEKEEGKQQED